MKSTDVRLQRRMDRALDLSSLAAVWAHPRVSTLRLVVNPRLRVALARWEPPGNVIQVSPAAAKSSPKALHEIVCHEAAHVVVWDRYGGSARPHGSEWTRLMRTAGVEPRAVLMRCGQKHRRKSLTLRFRHFCPVCHFERIAKRRVGNWRCPECRVIGLPGQLQVEQISQLPDFR